MSMKQQTEENSVRRDYKSRMFTMIFKDKKELLQLYNAVGQRNYDDPELLTINTLGDYSEYVYRVREYANVMSIEDAVDKAIDECIQEGILREFLESNRAEARAMSIYEYDQEQHIRLEREDAYADGHKAGREEGDKARLISQIQKKLEKGKSVEVIAEELEENVDVILAFIKEIEQK